MLPENLRAARALKLRAFGLWLVNDASARWFGWLRMHVCHAGTRRDGCKRVCGSCLDTAGTTLSGRSVWGRSSEKFL